MMPPAEFDRKFNKRYRSSRQRKANTRRSRDVDSYQTPKTKTKRRVARSNPFKKSAIKKYKEYDIEGAIDDFHKAIKIDSNDVSIYFNLACGYSLMEDKNEAYKYLSKAILKGFQDYERIMSHDDLAYLRIQPDFEAFKNSGFKPQRSQSTTDSPVEKPMDDVLLAQLNRLMELRKKGVLTEQEFLRERKKVLVR